MSDQALASRVAALERALAGPVKDPSKFRQERAEAQAIRDAEAASLRSPEGVRIQKLELELLQLKDYVKSMRGEEGIENDGPIFRLSRKPTAPLSDVLDAEELELTFCDEDDVQHTAIFYIKSGSVVPPF